MPEMEILEAYKLDILSVVEETTQRYREEVWQQVTDGFFDPVAACNLLSSHSASMMLIITIVAGFQPDGFKIKSSAGLGNLLRYITMEASTLRHECEGEELTAIQDLRDRILSPWQARV